MPKPYIMTLMAVNRVGVLAALTTALDELGGNLREVSQTVIQNFFTMIMAAEFPDDRPLEVIVEHIRAVCRPFGAEISIKDPAAEPTTSLAGGTTLKEWYSLTVVAEDQPGSLRDLVFRLAQSGIDVVDLHAASSADKTQYVARFALAVPARVDRLQLQHQLGEIGDRKGMSITLQHHLVDLATQTVGPLDLLET